MQNVHLTESVRNIVKLRPCEARRRLKQSKFSVEELCAGRDLCLEQNRAQTQQVFQEVIDRNEPVEQRSRSIARRSRADLKEGAK